jgi:hypothetical protein
VDLKHWIETDHASVAARFDNSIGQHVPQQYWKDAGPGGGPSIAWLLFHMTYHQDVALNTAVRNRAPLLGEHRTALGLDGFASAAGLSEAEDTDLVEELRLEKLDDYVVEVNASTSAWIAELSIMALDSIPEASWRLERQAGIPATGDFSWLHAMWTNKPVSWFVQWECIGHGHNHVGEMIGIRNRLGLSPF